MPLPDNLKKAAIFVASLDTDAADRLLDQMSEEQARLVRRAIMDLDPIDPTEERSVLEEFLSLGSGGATRPESSVESQRSVASNKRAWRVDPPQPETVPFHFLHHARGERITPLLTGEHPQTIALVVSHLPAEQAVEVLEQLPASLQVEVLHRVAHLDDTHPDVVREVEKGLHRRASEFIREEQRRESGATTLKKILSVAPGKLRRRLLDNLAHIDRPLAQELTPPPPQLEFDDLPRFSDAALRKVLQLAHREVVILALTDAPSEFVQRSVALLPATDRAAVRQALQHPGPIRLSDVSEAQRELAQLTAQLAADEAIELPYRQPALAA